MIQSSKIYKYVSYAIVHFHFSSNKMYQIPIYSSFRLRFLIILLNIPYCVDFNLMIANIWICQHLSWQCTYIKVIERKVRVKVSPCEGVCVCRLQWKIETFGIRIHDSNGNLIIFSHSIHTNGKYVKKNILCKNFNLRPMRENTLVLRLHGSKLNFQIKLEVKWHNNNKLVNLESTPYFISNHFHSYLISYIVSYILYIFGAKYYY